jgi:hypothetical protein
MLKLPDFNKAFDYENNFYLSCHKNRISKIITHYELFKRTIDLPGSIVEFGVFKGSSLMRLVMFRDLLTNSHSRKIIAFDTFDQYPKNLHEYDKGHVRDFIDKAGSDSLSLQQITKVLDNGNLNENIELIKGDICDTVPKYITDNEYEESGDSECIKVSLINLDTNFYQPTKVALEYFWPRLVRGGVLMLDDYGIVPGETRAVDEYFLDKNIKIQKIPLSMTPFFIVKD